MENRCTSRQGANCLLGTEGPPPDSVLRLAKKQEELDSVWADLLQAQRDYSALEQDLRDKDAEISDLEEVKMNMAFETSALEQQVGQLQQQLQQQQQQTPCSANNTAAPMRGAHGKVKAKLQKIENADLLAKSKDFFVLWLSGQPP